jgi:hypothetical protein
VTEFIDSDALPTAAPLMGAASAEKPARPIAVLVRTVSKIFRIFVSSFTVQIRTGERPVPDVVRRIDPVGPTRRPAVTDATSAPPQQPSTDLPCLMMFVDKAPNPATRHFPRKNPDRHRARIETAFC